MKAELVHSKDIDRARWDDLVSNSIQGSVYLESGFLDALLPGKWQGIIVCDDDGNMLALMPLFLGSKLGMKHALQPMITKYWGVAFKDAIYTNTYKEYSWKKKYLEAIINVIPKNLVSFSYNFHPEFDYPLPFYWKGYSLQTRFTYYLDTDLKSTDELFKNYGSSLKTNIRHAQKNGISIIEEHTAENLFEILPFSSKSNETIISPKYYPWFKAVFGYGRPSGKCYSFTALDINKKPIASSFILQDMKTIFVHSLFIHRDFRLSAASGLLMHHIITMAAEKHLKVDLTGSMIEPVEAFDRHFGARPVPYLTISKKNKLLSVLGN